MWALSAEGRVFTLCARETALIFVGQWRASTVLGPMTGMAHLGALPPPPPRYMSL